MSPIIFALISYLGWGTGDIFGTIATRKVGPYTATFYVYLIEILISSLYIPFALGALSNLTFGIFVFNLALGLIFLISTITFFEALRIGNASVVGTITSSFTALVVIFSIFFLKERLIATQIIAIIIIFLGITLTNLDFKAIKIKGLKLDKSILLALITMLIWGIYFTFIKIPIQHIGWFWTNFISLIPFPLLLIYRRKKGGIKKPSFSSFLPILSNASLVMVANYSFNFAISKGLTSVVAPIAGAYPTLFVLLAFLIFKDPIKKQQVIGMITTLFGIVLLGIFSV